MLAYTNAAQMSLLINAIQFDRFERLVFSSVGETSRSDVIRRCFVEGVPALSIPCYGERRFGHAQDDELAIGLPAEECARIPANLETQYKKGIRYPISPFGGQVSLFNALVPIYGISPSQDSDDP